MEGYSKMRKSKWQSQYSEEFRRKVRTEYLDGELGLHTLEKKYNLGNSHIVAFPKNQKV